LRHVQEIIFLKTKGKLLWADLILEILKFQHTETDIRNCLNASPTDFDAMATQLIQTRKIDLHAKEDEELNNIECPAQPVC
jgi:hypothetical protein